MSNYDDDEFDSPVHQPSKATSKKPFSSTAMQKQTTSTQKSVLPTTTSKKDSAPDANKGKQKAA